jgi:hypothetical protein
MEINAPHMTPMERDLYEAGHSEEFRGFVIKPKRDFGRTGYWSSEHRTNINAGWVICYGSGTYRGCNAAPGATFSWTLQGAREMIEDLIKAGGSGRCNEVSGGIDSELFWKFNYARHGIEYPSRNNQVTA